jgi:hypothetical protein
VWEDHRLDSIVIIDCCFIPPRFFLVCYYLLITGSLRGVGIVVPRRRHPRVVYRYRKQTPPSKGWMMISRLTSDW